MDIDALRRKAETVFSIFIVIQFVFICVVLPKIADSKVFGVAMTLFFIIFFSTYFLFFVFESHIEKREYFFIIDNQTEIFAKVVDPWKKLEAEKWIIVKKKKGQGKSTPFNPSWVILCSQQDEILMIEIEYEKKRDNQLYTLHKKPVYKPIPAAPPIPISNLLNIIRAGSSLLIATSDKKIYKFLISHSSKDGVDDFVNNVLRAL